MGKSMLNFLDSFKFEPKWGESVAHPGYGIQQRRGPRFASDERRVPSAGIPKSSSLKGNVQDFLFFGSARSKELLGKFSQKSSLLKNDVIVKYKFFLALSYEVG